MDSTNLVIARKSAGFSWILWNRQNSPNTVIAKHFEKMLWQSKKLLDYIKLPESFNDYAFSKKILLDFIVFVVICVFMDCFGFLTKPRKDGKIKSSLRDSGVFAWNLA